MTKKPLIIGACAFAGLLVIIALATMFSGASFETKRNVSVDLPYGGKIVVGEISGGRGNVTLTDIKMDDPNTRQHGSVEKIIISGVNTTNIKELKKVGKIEILNFTSDFLRVQSLVYEDLHLDFGLLESMNLDNPNPEDMKKLLQSFHLGRTEAKDFRMEMDSRNQFTIARSGATDCSINGAKDVFVENMQGKAEGATFSIKKYGIEAVSLPNILNLLSPTFLNGRPNPSDIADLFNGLRIKDLFVDGLMVNSPFGTISADRFSFDLENKNNSGEIALKFKNFQLPAAALADMGMANARNDMRLDGSISCNFNRKDNIVFADQKGDLSLSDFVTVDYKARTRFNMQNARVMNDSIKFVMKDKGMVNTLSPQGKMFMFAQGMQLDRNIGEGLKAFLSKPDQTITVNIQENENQANISVDVD